ncbi:MAG: response regulator [Lachnospiraceae bacterium]|jgi:two-component system response regulator YesN|nr:response regulator [Lachnospiraceae bacterium]
MNTDNTQKITVLIAEDEDIILNNIAKKIEKISPEFLVCGKAASGKEALELMSQNPCDILITDIEMPGINGLELINQVQKFYPCTRIVILSGYSNFEYARTAIRYGVVDYLLKPVSFPVLSELFAKLADEIRQEKYDRKREILSLALKGNLPDDMPPYMIPGKEVLLIHLTLGNPPSSYGTPPVKNCTTLWEALDLTGFFRQFPRLEHLWVVDEAYPLQKFLLLHLEDSSYPADYFCLSLQRYLCEHCDSLPFTGIIYPEAIPYSELWECAKKIRSFSKDHVLPFCRQVFPFLPKDTKDASLASCKDDIPVLYTLSTERALLPFLQTTTERYLSEERPAPVIYDLLHEGFLALAQLTQLESSLCQTAAGAFFGEFYQYANLSDCFDAYSKALHTLAETAPGVITNNTLCAKLHQYIQNHYRQRLSLSDLSAEFGYTDSYINRIFKKEYGQSPLQYINSLKLAHAKELLCTSPDLDIKTVASACGYEDARYFSRVFKNETGMTPSAWGRSKK